MSPMSMVYAKNNPKFIDVSGQLFIWGGGDVVPTPAGVSGNVILVVTGNDVEWTDDLAGDGLAGTGTANGHFLVHNYGTPDGWFSARNIHTLEAEVDGQSGTLTIISAGTTQGHWRILKGTGELANLHGQGTWETVTAPVLYSYEGRVHFDP
jgi:hypothetical protein